VWHILVLSYLGNVKSQQICSYSPAMSFSEEIDGENAYKSDLEIKFGPLKARSYRFEKCKRFSYGI
jgi:hypothetical protein